MITRNCEKDIMLLFNTLATNTERKESELLGENNSFDEVEFPLQSYMYLIKDFLPEVIIENRRFHTRLPKLEK